MPRQRSKATPAAAIRVGRGAAILPVLASTGASWRKLHMVCAYRLSDILNGLVAEIIPVNS